MTTVKMELQEELAWFGDAYIDATIRAELYIDCESRFGCEGWRLLGVENAVLSIVDRDGDVTECYDVDDSDFLRCLVEERMRFFGDHYIAKMMDRREDMINASS